MGSTKLKKSTKKFVKKKGQLTNEITRRKKFKGTQHRNNAKLAVLQEQAAKGGWRA